MELVGNVIFKHIQYYDNEIGLQRESISNNNLNLKRTRLFRNSIDKQVYIHEFQIKDKGIKICKSFVLNFPKNVNWQLAQK